MHPMLNIAIKAARVAGNVIVKGFERKDSLAIGRKGPNNFYTEIDKIAENRIIAILKKVYPDHTIIAEESGIHHGNEFSWIIDPIDGTNNFIHGIPHFAVSIALKIKNNFEHAVIYDPICNDLFTASRGGGAKFNDRRLRITPRKNLRESILAISLSNNLSNNNTSIIDLINFLTKQKVSLRYLGSAALDLAYIAASRLDGLYESNLKIWDVAAGTLLVREAGGFVNDFQSNENYLDSDYIIAANPKIFSILLQLLKKYGITQL